MNCTIDKRMIQHVCCIQMNKDKEIKINPSRYYVNWTRLLLTGIIPVSSLVYFNTRIFKVSVLDLDLHIYGILLFMSDFQKLYFNLVCNILFFVRRIW